MCNISIKDIGAIDEKNYQNICNFVIASKHCSKVPVDDRVRCDQIDDNKIDTLSWGFIKNCGIGLFDSIIDFVKFIKDIVVWTIENINSEKRNKRIQNASVFYQSLQNYIAIEYYKALANHETDSVPKLAAAKDVFAQVFKLAVEKITRTIEKSYVNFGCFKPEIRSEKVCKAFGDIIMPPAMAIGVIMKGPKLLSKALHPSWIKKTENIKDVKKVEELTNPIVKDGPGNPKLIKLITDDSIEADNFIGLGDKLKNNQIDPKMTNIEEFAKEVPAHIEYYKKSILDQNIETDRLKILEEFSIEASQRIANKSVTYEWWIAYNHRLSLLATPSTKRSALAAGEENLFDLRLIKNEAWKTNETYQNTIKSMPKEDWPSLEAYNAIGYFPESIMIPTIHKNGELSVGFLNEVHGHGYYPIGLSPKNAFVDGREMYPDQFFRHDFVHAANDRYVVSRSGQDSEAMKKLSEKYKLYREKIPVEGDRRSAFEVGYFIATHELGFYIDDVLRSRPVNLSKRDNLFEYFLDESWFKNMEEIPKWATQDEESAKTFIKMMDQELNTFGKTFTP